MIKNNNPYLIEFNIRMGDPECQVILPRLKTDLFEIILASINNNLRRIKIKWKNLKCMTIVLCAKGYPSKYKKNIDLKVLKKIKLDKNSFIFHAGTQILKGNIFSTGGRILNITTVGKNFSSIKDKILMNIKKLNLKNSFFRKDIGWRVIK